MATVNLELYRRIKKHTGETDVIRKGLAHEASPLITELLELSTAKTSLRQLAKDIGCSATYLSCVWNGHFVCSPHIYVALSDLLQNRIKITGNQKGLTS